MNQVSKVFVLVALFAASFTLGFRRQDGGRSVVAVPAPAEAGFTISPGGTLGWGADGPCAGGKPMSCLKCNVWGECTWTCVGDYFCVYPGQRDISKTWEIPRVCSYHDGRCKS